jgi:predicted MPP superfamily phosphohydrolase
MKLARPWHCRILVRSAVLGCLSLVLAITLSGLNVVSSFLAATIYAALVGGSLILRVLWPNVLILLPERQGRGVASAAGLLYWEIGYGFPASAAGLAVLQTSPLSRVDYLILMAAAVAFIMSLYAMLVEPRWVLIQRYDLPITEISPSLDGFRIVHVSDLHIRRPGKNVTRLVQRINALTPDLVCVTGDLADDMSSCNSPGLSGARQFLRKLCPVHGTFVTYGDWDGATRDWQSIEAGLFRDTRARPLNDSIATIDAGREGRVTVLGRAPAHLYAKRNYMEQLPRQGLSIVLHHFPFAAIRAAELGAHLFLAGHTHGGQVRLPWVGALTPSVRGGKDPRGRKLPRRFVSGLHRIGATWVHVSRGIGTRGGDAPPIRLGCRPEITLLTIRSIA